MNYKRILEESILTTPNIAYYFCLFLNYANNMTFVLILEFSIKIYCYTVTRFLS